jgi:hypothetical protein
MELDVRMLVYRACAPRLHDNSQGANLGLIAKDRIADSHVALAREWA